MMALFEDGGVFHLKDDWRCFFFGETPRFRPKEKNP